MKKTITDPMQVKTGDKAYFKDCDFGFTVLDTYRSNPDAPLNIYDPLIGRTCWPHWHRFDHATREIEEPEWPNPHDIELHVYIGSDGKRYIYNPVDEDDTTPWVAEGRYAYRSRESMEADYRDALPLTELKLVPAEDDNNEQ